MYLIYCEKIPSDCEIAQYLLDEHSAELVYANRASFPCLFSFQKFSVEESSSAVY